MISETIKRGDSMGKVIFIHGAWHGGWCWDRVAKLLVLQGHEVEAPDLPAQGNDTTPIQDVTLDSYVNRICEVLDRQKEPVILVAHSMGGISVTQAAEFRPDKIRALVYVTAFLPRNGESLGTLNENAGVSAVAQNMVFSDDFSSATIREDALKDLFYNDCSDQDIEYAQSLLRPIPTSTTQATVQTSEENFERIPRIYVECLQDHTIPPHMQKMMIEATPCKKVYTLDSSHSPFLSMPEKLAAILAEVARSD